MGTVGKLNLSRATVMCYRKLVEDIGVVEK
jgi:hypothetical protein